MLDYSIASEKGSTKDYMEDTHYVDTSPSLQQGKVGVFAGVYDGHKGSEAALYAKDNLHKYFFKEIKNKNSPKEAFKFAYEKTSKELKNSLSGTTAVNFYVDGSTLYWANTGDSRLILIDKNNKPISLSVMHRVDNPEEAERIKRSGGIIDGEYAIKDPYGIQPTRAIGDKYFQSIGIMSTPSAGQHELSSKDKWILAGSDGLFDFASDEEIAEITGRHESARSAAEELKKFLLEGRGGRDNLTFILLKNNFV